MRFDEVLRTFSEFFEREGVRYALAGGLALVALGHTRPTHDADFVIDGTARERVLTFAESLGYRTVNATAGYSNHTHASPDSGTVDFIYVHGPTADEMFSASKRMRAFGVEMPVARPEHIIAMKVTAMNNAPRRVLIDAPDIAFLLSLPGVDHAKAREYFARHGLLKIYDELEKDHRR